MSDTQTQTTRRSPFSRGGKAATGPRATFRQLLPFLFEHRPVLIWVAVLSVIGALTSLAQPLLVAQVITIVEAGQPLGWIVWGLIALVIISGIISGYQHYLLQRTGEGVVLSSRKRLVAKLLRLPIAEFDTRRTGDLVSRVGSDTTMLRAVLTQGLVEAVGGAVTFIGALIAMLILDAVLLGLTVLVIAIAITTVTLLSRRVREASHQAQEKVGDVAASVERAISAVRTIRAAGATEREIRTVDTEAEGAWQMGVKVAKISALIVPIAGIAMQVSFLVVLGVGGYRVASGAITVANLVAFILFLFMMILPLGQAFGAITSVNLALGALGRIQEILDLPDEDAYDRELAPLALMVGEANDGVLPGCRGDRVRRRALRLRGHPAGPGRSRQRLPRRAPARARRHGAPAGAARRLLRGAARTAHRAGRPVGRRQVDDPRPRRALLRPERRRGAHGRPRPALARPARAARADRVRRAGRPGAGAARCATT